MTSGTVIASIAAGVATDGAGNGNTASTSTDNTVTFDTTAPTVAINQAAGQLDPTNAAPVNFTVVFSEAVSGFTGADVTITGTAGGTKTVAVSGGPSTYNVAVSGMTSGTVIASIAAGVATDGAGNGNTASTSTDNTVTFDTTAVTVTINQAVGQADPTSASPINFTVVFSEAVSGFTGADVTITGSAGGTKTVAVSGGPSTYTVAVSGMTSGTVIASIAAGVATDGAGNGNTASTSTDNTVTFDTTAPTVAINQAAGQLDPTNAAPINFTVVFSEAVTGFTGADVTISGTAGGTKTVTVSGGPSTYTVSVSGMTSGTVIASIAAGGASDGAGNGNAASTSTDNTVTFDTTAVTVNINQAVGQADPTNGSPINFTVVFSEAVSAFTGGDVTITGTAGGTKTMAVSGGPSTYTVSVSGMTSGTVIATIAAGVATDGAGNGNAASTSTDNTVTFDTTPPTVAVTSPASGGTVSGTVPVTASASDEVGITGVQLLVDGAALGAEDITDPYSAAWDTTAVTDGSHALTAVARDAAGNTTTSAPITVTVSNGPPSTPSFTRFENTDVSITYTDGNTAPGQPAGWWHGSRSRGWSGRIASFNRSDGAQARFRFTGTTVRWIGFRAPWAGIARVYVDDVFISELDLYATTEQVQAVAFSRTGLTNGTHTLTVESTGRKNPAAVDYAIVVDAFDVSPPSPPPLAGTRVEETGLSLTGGWAPDAQPTRAWSGGAAAVSATPGAQATSTFVGTEVRWIGLRGPQTGIARVFLDGSFQSEVDTYAPSEIQGVVFTATSLAAGRHTLRIEVTGEKNVASTGSSIVVDALDVRARVEDANASVAYTGDWVRENFARAWSGTSMNAGSGSAALSRTAGAQATVTFTGTQVSWIGLRAPWTGTARVLVDGAFMSQVDTYAAAEELQKVLFSATGLTDGSHTFTIEATGTRNPASTDSLVVVDAFDLTLSSSAPPITRFQETAPATTYTGAWTQGSRLDLWSGETAAYSGTAGVQATFTFTGTGVRWIGQTAFTGGIARVLLDGVEVAQVDTFAPVEEEYQAALFSTTGLPGASHTLTIQATGLKNALAQGAFIFVDAFDIH
jgi:YD repeat-containing protein